MTRNNSKNLFSSQIVNDKLLKNCKTSIVKKNEKLHVYISLLIIGVNNEKNDMHMHNKKI